MELKTKVEAVEGEQTIVIKREFDLPVGLLFRAHADPAIVAQWMGTNVVRLDGKKYGGWQFETKNGEGQKVFGANGVFHDFEEPKTIVRTFEMEGGLFPPQLEFFDFEETGERKSLLTMTIVFKSTHFRDEMLKLPFAQGISIAHDRLQAVAGGEG